DRTLSCCLPARSAGVFRFSTDLERGSVGLALVVDPTYFDVVALGAAVERKFYIGVLRYGRSPLGDEYLPAVMFEGQFPDVMRRDEFAPVIPDEAGIHRMLDQRLELGGVAFCGGAHADPRCHQSCPIGSCAQPPQPPTVTLTSLVALKSLPPASTITMTLLVFAILSLLETLGSVPCTI